MDMARQSAPSTPVPVLLTRPKDAADAFAIAVQRRFGSRVRPVITPLMAVEYLSPTLPEGPFAGVIFTSATGIEAAGRIRFPQSGLAWCVGRRTAERAAAAGYHARSAEGDAAALVAAIRADPPTGKLLHLRGEETRGEVAGALISSGIEIESIVVYRQLPQPLSPEAQAILLAGGPVILPLFSPRSAALFRARPPGDPRATLWLVTMSRAVTEAARDIPHRALVEATQPDAPAMLAAVELALDRVSPP
jgi:uroporphyrinogen-III synthase